jgi:hypothetical protein
MVVKPFMLRKNISICTKNHGSGSCYEVCSIYFKHYSGSELQLSLLMVECMFTQGRHCIAYLMVAVLIKVTGPKLVYGGE